MRLIKHGNDFCVIHLPIHPLLKMAYIPYAGLPKHTALEGEEGDLSGAVYLSVHKEVVHMKAELSIHLLLLFVLRKPSDSLTV